ncbi:CC0125/CC1285 family lipoprotein [Planctobacterium marinum]|uniref:CC0125/CC1285 family lipoprotein n=1 Tax=Planctobacterium marinum TaxID=1631968 RepID=UPI001E5D0A2C|nr:hypothetical protein [Planctobacterium marinum]MCC2607021.1 hypothetical protein [Planctobacterium marinum]
MTIFKSLFFSSLILLLASCASMQPTPYTMAPEKGDFGYTHTKLTDTKYRITFRGNRVTDKETIRDYTLLHAADLTLEQGYDWFYIDNQDMETNKKRVQTGTNVGATTTATSTRCGLLGCTTVHHPHYTGAIIESEEITKDHVNVMTVSMGKGEPTDPNRVYDAKALAKNIRSTI